MTLECAAFIAIGAAFLGGLFAMLGSSRSASSSRATIFMALLMTALSTFAAIKDGLSHGEGLEMLVIAWIAMSVTIYLSRACPERDEGFRSLFTASAAIGFITCFYFTPSAMGRVLFWIASSAPIFIRDGVAWSIRRPGERTYFFLDGFSILSFVIATVLGEQSISGRVAFVVSSLLRLGIFPAHLGITGFLDHTSLGNRLTYMLRVLISLTVCSTYLHPLLLETGTTRLVTIFFLASAIFFALVCAGQTQLRRVLIFAVFSSLSVILAVFAVSATEDGAHAAWILSVNAVVAACALFICDDAIMRRIGSTDSALIQGLSAAMPVLGGFSLIAFFELVNVPMSWGFRGGEMALSVLFDLSVVTGILSVIAWGFLTFALIRNFAKLFWGPTTLRAIAEIDLNRRERWALLILAALIVLPIW